MRQAISTLLTAEHDFSITFPAGSAAERELDDVFIRVVNHKRCADARALVWPFLRSVAIHMTDAEFEDVCLARLQLKESFDVPS